MTRRTSTHAGLCGVFVCAMLVSGCTGRDEASAGRGLEVWSHRGVYQRYDRTNLGRDECTATRIVEPVQPFIENTLASMERAFTLGADVIEIDVHPTTDGHFVVFHDWTLDCRTDGAGETRSHPLTYLKGLDVGWGYTADGGRTYPLRGQGVGQMPTLAEAGDAAQRFPGRRLLVNLKGSDPAEADLMMAYLGRHPGLRDKIMVYGSGEAVIARLKRIEPGLHVFSKQSMKDCAKAYLLSGWFRFPRTCSDTTVFLPINYAGFAWGWPDGIARRFERHGSDIVLVGPAGGGGSGGFSGINDTETFARVPSGWTGGLMTDEITVIGPIANRSALVSAPTPTE